MEKIFVAQPTLGQSTFQQAHYLRLIAKRYANKVELVYPDECVVRRPVDNARNQLVKQFLKTDADCIWFIDADVVPPPNALDDLADDRIVHIPYLLFLGNRLTWSVFDQVTKGGWRPQSWNDDLESELAWFESAKNMPCKADGCGMGCTLIPRQFLQGNGPWFRFQHDDDGGWHVGEDFDFFERLNKPGIVYYNMDIVAEHNKEVPLLRIWRSMR